MLYPTYYNDESDVVVFEGGILLEGVKRGGDIVVSDGDVVAIIKRGEGGLECGCGGGFCNHIELAELALEIAQYGIEDGLDRFWGDLEVELNNYHIVSLEWIKPPLFGKMVYTALVGDPVGIERYLLITDPIRRGQTQNIGIKIYKLWNDNRDHPLLVCELRIEDLEEYDYEGTCGRCPHWVMGFNLIHHIHNNLLS